MGKCAFCVTTAKLENKLACWMQDLSKYTIMMSLLRMTIPSKFVGESSYCHLLLYLTEPCVIPLSCYRVKVNLHS